MLAEIIFIDRERRNRSEWRNYFHLHSGRKVSIRIAGLRKTQSDKYICNSNFNENVPCLEEFFKREEFTNLEEKR